MFCIPSLLLSLLLLGHDVYPTLAHQSLSNQAPQLVTAITHISRASNLTQTSNTFDLTDSAGGIHAINEHSMDSRASVLSNKPISAHSRRWRNFPRNIFDVPTQLPTPLNGYYDRAKAKYLANYDDIKSGFCGINDDFCSFKASNGTMIESNATSLSDKCVLWDDTCSGNRTVAIEQSFDIALLDRNSNEPSACGMYRGLLCNRCFQQSFVNQSDCDTYNPPERLSKFKRIKDWMRSSQCVSAADDWIAMTGYLWGYFFGTTNQSKAEYLKFLVNSSEMLLPSCCGGCLTWAQNVDLCYWPEPDSDTSYLSIVGESVRPVEYGATTESGTTYWECSVSTITLTTAQITTIGSLAVKVSRYSPWSFSPCVEDEAGPHALNRSIRVRNEYASVHRRAHSLIMPTSITQADGLPISTVVFGGFTFTSPFIYANFYGLRISDLCGSSVISTTMLSFSAGELSTIEGPLGIPGLKVPRSKRFDFRDLPCPPQSIMEVNWYKPQPGEPYRPLLAMPSRIREVFRAPYCDGYFLTAYDPPSALTAVTALAPPIPPGDAKAYPSAPVSSITLDPPARVTINPEASTPVPASIPRVDQPKVTINASPVPPREEAPSTRHKDNHPKTQESPPSQVSTQRIQLNNNPKAEHSPQKNGDPKQDNNPSQATDPNHDSDPKPQQNNDTKKGNGPNQASDPKPQQNNVLTQVNEPKQGSSNSKNSGQKADSKPSNDPNEVVNSEESNQNPVPVSQNDPKQMVEAYASNSFAKDQAKTTNNQILGPLSHGISAASTTLTSKAPLVTLSSPTASALHDGNTALAGLNSEINPKIAAPITASTIIINGQSLTVNSTALAMVGNALISPSRAPGLTVNGTIVSRDTAAQLVVGPETIPLDTGGSNGETAGVGGSMTGAFGSGGSVGAKVPGPGHVSKGMRGRVPRCKFFVGVRRV